MTKLLVDETLRGKLNGLNEGIEFCDPSGRTLGRFIPEDQYRQLLYAWVERQCPLSEEELERREEEPGGKPLAEIWKDLGAE